MYLWGTFKTSVTVNVLFFLYPIFSIVKINGFDSGHGFGSHALKTA
jgi:hypothetical protein